MEEQHATPLVSVVIATYNSAQFVRECLYAIVSQTYRNIEIIVVDDGSVDDTVAIIKAEFDGKMKLITQSNQKVAAARHNGVQHASGEYVAFCDHDDVWVPDKIEKQLHFLSDNVECCLIHSDAEEIQVMNGTKTLYSELHPHIKDQEVIFSNMIRKFAVPLFSTVLIRMAFLKQHDIQFKNMPPGVDDLGVFLQIIMSGGAMAYMEEPLVVRRMHSSNQSSDYLLRFQRRIALYSYLLERNSKTAEEKYLCDIRWGLSDAACRVADSTCRLDTVDETKRLYRIAWVNNYKNIKAFVKMIVLIFGGCRLLVPSEK